MRVAVSIEHPAWAHQFRSIIDRNNATGDTLVLAVDKDGDLTLLDSFGIDYIKLADTTGSNVVQKAFLFIKLCISYTHEIRKFNPDVLIGRASPMMAVAAKVTKKPQIVFEDTEVSRFSLGFCKRFSSCIITPRTFHTDLGAKQIRMPIYKELFYLHEKEFSPNPRVLDKCGINHSKPYAIVRFISWNASHDVGMGGISDEKKVSFVEELAKLIPVYISSENDLPEALKKYQLKIPFEDIHHVLYYATVVISEGASMASEAAILGTHSFYLNEIASGTTEEQENRFHLLRVLHDPKTRYDIALQEAKELLMNPNLWHEGKEKRKIILSQMPDPNDFFWQKMEEAVAKYGMER